MRDNRGCQSGCRHATLPPVPAAVHYPKCAEQQPARPTPDCKLIPSFMATFLRGALLPPLALRQVAAAARTGAALQIGASINLIPPGAPRSSMATAAGAGAAAGGASPPLQTGQQQQQQAPLAAAPLQHSEVLLATTFDSRDRWAAYLRGAGLRLLVHPEDTQEGADLSEVEYAVCWNPPPGLLQRCSNLKAIQSMGAGVDSMIGEPSLPRHIPLLRVIDPLMSERMATWVLWGVINCQRKFDAYMAAQREADRKSVV